MQLSLSVEDTNKIRQRLGLKLIPLTAPACTHAERLRDRALALTKKEPSKPERQRLATESNSVREHTGLDSEVAEPTSSWISKMRAQAKEADAKAQAKEADAKAQAKEADAKAQAKEADAKAQAKEADAKAQAKEADAKVPGSSTDWPEDRPKVVNEEIASSAVPDHDSQNSPKEEKPRETRIAVFKPKKVKVEQRRKVPNGQVIRTSRRNNDPDSDMMLEALIRKSHQRHAQAVKGNDRPTIAVGPRKMRKFSVSRPVVESVPSGDQEPESAPEHTPTSESLNTEAPTIGVADTLKRLKQSSSKSLNTSRSWAKQLVDSQKSREVELQILAKKYSNLPANEREEALRIHKDQLRREQALEAQNFATHYDPEVHLENRDANGNLITPRQAFRELSKAFHERTGR